MKGAGRPRGRDRGDDPAARRLWGHSAPVGDLHDLPELLAEPVTADTVLRPIAAERGHDDIFLVSAVAPRPVGTLHGVVHLGPQVVTPGAVKLAVATEPRLHQELFVV